MHTVWSGHLFYWYRHHKQLGVHQVQQRDLLAYDCGHQQRHMRGMRGWDLWDRLRLSGCRELHKVSAWHRHTFYGPHNVAELHTVRDGQVPRLLRGSSMHRLSCQHLPQQDRGCKCDQLHELSFAEHNYSYSFHGVRAMPVQCWLLSLGVGTTVFALQSRYIQAAA